MSVGSARWPSYVILLPQMLVLPHIPCHLSYDGRAEIDAMGCFVGKNTQQQWLWHAMDHRSGLGCASVFGRRKDALLLHRKALLEPFGLTPLPAEGGMPTRGMEMRRSLRLPIFPSAANRT